ncbi:transglutaminase-like domain-containing protein [Asanoa sp. WMMD1127]|uniref:transglutaminase-like domain-containing protein n=1 Tax=Asanoa sp. WMMD1127 TaxID=3016107 RepID=UPI0024165B30|nr:transglutaminase-like domain-containing protein [Asanoa sp. WMMD1127]MDG4824090.1 transglutaminase-like domain-containing protein [Asanoa sp. WMMD1127]
MNLTRQTAYSDPGAYAHLLDKLPTDPRELTAVVRNVITHYRDPTVTLPADHADDINHRWIDRLLATDQARHDCPLDVPRAPDQRVGGCCRDFSLLTVSALRHQGVPARVRIGFADYFFVPGWHHDHVVVDYWNGDRWVLVDPQIGPGDWPFDPDDMPRPEGVGTPFATAAAVWTAYRRGEIDAETYGVDPSMPIRGPWLIHGYVIGELAARQGDELLLWDIWGGMSDHLDEAGAVLTDEVAGLLLAADAGDERASAELAERYAADDRLNPRGQVLSMSPNGGEVLVDLASRVSAPAPTRAGH